MTEAVDKDKRCLVCGSSSLKYEPNAHQERVMCLDCTSTVRSNAWDKHKHKHKYFKNAEHTLFSDLTGGQKLIIIDAKSKGKCESLRSGVWSTAGVNDLHLRHVYRVASCPMGKKELKKQLVEAYVSTDDSLNFDSVIDELFERGLE